MSSSGQHDQWWSDSYLSQDGARVSIERFHLKNVVVVIEAGVTQHPVRLPVSETRRANLFLSIADMYRFYDLL